MPQLHRHEYSIAHQQGGRAACLERAIAAVDYEGVLFTLQQEPKLARASGAGTWLEDIANNGFELFTCNYNDVTPDTKPHELNPREHNYLSPLPSEWEFRQEGLKIINHLVKRGASPLASYLAPADPPEAPALCAAEYVFSVDTDSESNLQQKSQVVLHALAQKPSFRPRVREMFASLVDMDQRDNENYQRQELSEHIAALGQHISARLLVPTTALEKRVVQGMSKADKRDWIFPKHGWAFNEEDMPHPTRAFRQALVRNRLEQESESLARVAPTALAIIKRAQEGPTNPKSGPAALS